jgi:hypothetical protein
MGIQLDTGSRMNDIFLAFGDSFTWGHGLQYYDWIKNSKMSKEEIKDFLLSDLQGSHYQWMNLHHKITNRDLESIKSLRYIDLISKELDMDYITKVKNGGENRNNINLIGNTLLRQVDMDPNHPGYRGWGPPHWWPDKSGKKPDFRLQNDKLLNREIKFVILQLTHISRDLPLEHERVGDWDYEEEYKECLHNTTLQIKELYKLCKELNVQLLVWSYPADIAYFIRNEPYFVKIPYANREYNSYEDLIPRYPVFCLGRLNQGEKAFEIKGDLGHYGVTDEHPSKHFHKLISDVLLNKLKKDNE